MYRSRPRAALFAGLFAFLGGLATSGRDALDALANSPRSQSFGQRYGNNPKSHNGGQRSGAAAQKRASRRRRNVAKRVGRR